MAENLNNLCLSPLTIAMGRNVQVITSLDPLKPSLVAFKAYQTKSIAIRIFATALAICIFPLTLSGLFYRKYLSDHFETVKLEKRINLHTELLYESLNQKSESIQLLIKTENMENREGRLISILDDISMLLDDLAKLQSPFDQEFNKKFFDCYKEGIDWIEPWLMHNAKMANLAYYDDDARFKKKIADHFLSLKRSSRIISAYAQRYYQNENNDTLFFAKFYKTVRTTYYHFFSVRHFVRNLGEKKAIPSVDLNASRIFGSLSPLELNNLRLALEKNFDEYPNLLSLNQFYSLHSLEFTNFILQYKILTIWNKRQNITKLIDDEDFSFTTNSFSTPNGAVDQAEKDCLVAKNQKLLCLLNTEEFLRQLDRQIDKIKEIREQYLPPNVSTPIVINHLQIPFLVNVYSQLDLSSQLKVFPTFKKLHHKFDQLMSDLSVPSTEFKEAFNLENSNSVEPDIFPVVIGTNFKGNLSNQENQTFIFVPGNKLTTTKDVLLSSDTLSDKSVYLMDINILKAVVPFNKLKENKMAYPNLKFPSASKFKELCPATKNIRLRIKTQLAH